MEEFDVKVQAPRLIMRRRAEDSSVAVAEDGHHLLRATMKDGSKWVVDLSGAQHGQHQPVLRAKDYKREYIEKVVHRREYGSIYDHAGMVVNERDPKIGSKAARAFLENVDYQEDELAEWQHRNSVTIRDILLADDQTYQNLKNSLVSHVATAAREYVKLARKDPTSKAKRIIVTNTNAEDVSEEEKGRQERKRARKLVKMHPHERKRLQDLEARGDPYWLY